MALQESGEMYLESIYVLSKTNETVLSIDVCEYMGYSKPSVSRAVKILRENGYVTMGADGNLSLTEKGLGVAESMYKRHTILTSFLVSLGVDEETAANDACKAKQQKISKAYRPYILRVLTISSKGYCAESNADSCG